MAESHMTSYCKKHGATDTFHCHECKIEAGRQSWKNRTPEMRASKENAKRRQAATERILQIAYTYIDLIDEDELRELFEDLEATGWQPEEAKI